MNHKFLDILNGLCHVYLYTIHMNHKNLGVSSQDLIGLMLRLVFLGGMSVNHSQDVTYVYKLCPKPQSYGHKRFEKLLMK